MRPLDTLVLTLGHAAVLGCTPVPAWGRSAQETKAAVCPVAPPRHLHVLASWTPTLILSEDAPKAFSFAFVSFTLVAFLTHLDTWPSIFFSSEADGTLQDRTAQVVEWGPSTITTVSFPGQDSWVTGVPLGTVDFTPQPSLGSVWGSLRLPGSCLPLPGCSLYGAWPLCWPGWGTWSQRQTPDLQESGHPPFPIKSPREGL